MYIKNRDTLLQPKAIISILFVTLATIALSACGLPPYYKTKNSVQKLKQLRDFKSVSTKIDNQPFHFVHTGNVESQPVLFIHGSPGDWEAWADYLLDDDLREKAFLIAVDRIGFGGSNDNRHEPSLMKQSSTIKAAVENAIPTLRKKKIILVGHSYGGPVALRYNVDYPESTKATLVLAPSIDPKLETVKWYNHLANIWPIRHIIPTPVHHSNQEIIPLKAELEIMKPNLKEVKTPMTVIQGMDDTLVPPGNAKFAKAELKNAQIKIDLIPKRGHFVPWQEYELVKKRLLEYLASPIN